MSREVKTVWAAYTNSDCTEGRGHDIVIAVCRLKETAIRLASRKYVQGSDGPVRPLEMIEVDGKWYAPAAAVSLIEPSSEDLKLQAKHIEEEQRKIAKETALDKARALGLSDDDIIALRG
jgi:hypothetical protein